MKKSILILLLLTYFVILNTKTNRDYKANNEDVDVKISYSYEIGQKSIVVNGEFTNISDTILFVSKYNEEEWSRKILYEKKDYSLDLLKKINPKEIFWHNLQFRLYELKPKQTIKFQIEVEFNSEEYDELVNNDYHIDFGYYYYSPALEEALTNRYLILFDLYFYYNSIQLTLLFK
jgi:hypothetical protein